MSSPLMHGVTSEDDVLALARATLEKEAAALEAAADRINPEFARAVDLVMRSPGRVVATGLGKSGVVARKIAGTLAGTGSPAMFLHPVDALHGECGAIRPEDVIIALSRSGETREVIDLVVAMKSQGCPTVAVVGDVNSTLGRLGDATLDAFVESEACPLNLAPTSSALVAMALGDAMAACLVRRRQFTSSDFGRLHPAGSLGRRLLLKVGGVMHAGEALPLVRPATPIGEALVTLSGKAMGAVLVVDAQRRLLGIYTDGDLRRTLEQTSDFLQEPIADRMTSSPVFVGPDELAIEALERMENRPSQISVLPVVDSEHQVVGIVRIHDLLRAGLR